MEEDLHITIDEDILYRVVNLAKIKSDEIVLEIGAGTGNLTKLLVERAKLVYAIEKNEKLISDLEKIKAPNLKIILGNALTIKFPKFDKIVANIPFSISEPIIQKLIYENFKLGVLCFPENFVKILCGERKTKLTLISNLFFDIKLDRRVYPESFYPKPKVFSRIVLLKLKNPKKDELIFREFIKQRDKKAKNALREALITGRNLTKREARNILKNFEIDKKVASLSLKELEFVWKLIREKLV